MNNGAVVVDMRNHYESEIGHFDGAICPDSETFKQELPKVKECLKAKKKKRYCCIVQLVFAAKRPLLI